jgi:hypothetical protein
LPTRQNSSIPKAFQARSSTKYLLLSNAKAKHLFE